MKPTRMVRCTVAALLAIAATALGPACAPAQTIRAVMHSDLKILDPIWATAYIIRDHGYMIYDTLFALDAKGQPQPQMIDSWEVSPDALTYTFRLRDGLTWHDGAPVTAEDCIASIKRWGARDSMGQKMLSFTAGFKVIDEKTFSLSLKEPYGLVILSLAKPSSNVPFMMPKRIAETSPTEQISEFVGSGPFVFKKDQWKPGEKVVYERFKDYKPRSEPPSGAAGAKVVKVDRVEWIAIPDSQTAVNALIAGEVDLVEDPPFDLFPVLRAESDIGFADVNTLGNQFTLRFNHAVPPFDNPKIRHAAMVALDQLDFLQAQVGDAQYYKECRAMFICGAPFASDKGSEGVLQGDAASAKKLLQDAGYDGTPILLMHSTDLSVLANLAPVAKQLWERAGFKVTMVDMDWQTLVSRRAKRVPVADGGWNAFITSWVAADVLNPISAAFIAANCEKAAPGWPCDETLEKLRDAFARETDPEKQKALAAQVQQRAYEIAAYGPLGQWYKPMAYRKDRLAGFIEAPAPLFWNVAKKGD
jgi:peptide/nickel transport system substrate-binding protein